MNIYAFNCLQPRRPGARTHYVRIVCVLARDRAEAEQAVCAEQMPDVRVCYRHSWEPGELFTYAHQSWSREDVATWLRENPCAPQGTWTQPNLPTEKEEAK